MADCKHEWFPGFFSCICLNCKMSLPFDAFVKEYGQKLFGQLCKKAGEDYDQYRKDNQ